eukprot:2920410-Ditylum_brightwellii.AAC.1
MPPTTPQSTTSARQSNPQSAQQQKWNVVTSSTTARLPLPSNAYLRSWAIHSSPLLSRLTLLQQT